jgi:uncharacterized protein YndB with AHSA1/START domain
MPKVSYQASVAFPPAIVFDFVADAEKNPRWHAHVNETTWMDPPPTRVGRRGRQTGHLFGRDWAFVAEVVEFEPPRLVTFQVIQGYRVRTSIEVEPNGAEGSTVTLTVTTPPTLPGPIDALVGRLLRHSTEARARGDVARLTRALETEVASLAR